MRKLITGLLGMVGGALYLVAGERLEARGGAGGLPGGSRGGGPGHRTVSRGFEGENASFAAGGGGGSVSFVRVYATTKMIDLAAVISPAPVP